MKSLIIFICILFLNSIFANEGGVNFILLPQQQHLLEQNGSENTKFDYERNQLIKAVHSLFPQLLQQYLENEEISDDNLLLIAKDVLSVVQESPSKLVFSEDQSLFDQAKGGKNRLMATSSIMSEDIYVNSLILNAKKFDLELEDLFTLIFHEYGHKTTHENWTERDHIARKFSEFVQNFIKKYSVDNDREVLVLSLPLHQLNTDFANVARGEVQPTFMILVDNGKSVMDLTKSFTGAFAEKSKSLTNMGAELRYLMISGLAGPMAQVLEKVAMEIMVPFMKAFGHSTDIDEATDALSQVKDMASKGTFELRFLDIHNVEIIKNNNSVRYVFHTSFSIKKNDYTKINFNMGESGILDADFDEVSAQIALDLPYDHNDVFQAQSMSVSQRNSYDLDSEAKITAYDSGTFNDVITIELSYPAKPLMITLNLSYGSSYISLPVAEARMTVDGNYEMDFEVPEDVIDGEIQYSIESLSVDFEKTVLLENSRFVGGSKINNNLELKNLVSNIYFQTSKDGQIIWKSDVKNDDPLVLWPLKAATGNQQSLFDPGQGLVKVVLEKNIDMKEVRLHYYRTLLIAKVEEDRQGETATINVNGQPRRFARSGSMEASQTIKETYVVHKDSIKRDDENSIVFSTSLNMKFIRDLTEEESHLGHYPQIMVPFLIEIITEDLTTITHNFTTDLVEMTESELSRCVDELIGK